MTQRVLVAVALLAACADLPEVASDVCGNKVLDGTEDCDGFSAFGEDTACGAVDTENACHYVCTDSASCPEGWGCGLDGRCRQPTGTFEPGPGSPWGFRVGQFGIGDVDGDGRADLIGSNASTITIRFGAEDGEFPSEVDLRTRQPSGPVSFTHFDQDAKLDVVLPTEGGIFSLLGASGGLEPLAYTSVTLPDAPAIKIGVLEAITGNFVSEVVLMYQNVLVFAENDAGAITLPGSFTAQNLAGRIPAADLDGNGRWELALGFVQADAVYLYTPTGLTAATLTPSTYATVALPNGMKVRSGVQFADVDGDDDDDLLIAAQDVANRSRVLVSFNTAGFLGAAQPFPVLDEITEIENWPLAIGNLTEDLVADYVLPRAIAVALPAGQNGLPNALFPVAGNQATSWSEAAVGDFNGDGWQDVATAVEGVDGVDFFLNSGSSLLNQFRVDTDRPPRILRVGDYDGDRVMDLAFSELPAFEEPDRLSVIFGAASGGPSDAVSMAQLDYMEVMEPLVTVLSAEGFDFITDLIVVSAAFPDRDARLLTIMQGNSSRRMLAPFILSRDINSTDDQPRWVLVGNFTEDKDDARDLLALTDERGDVLGGSDPGEVVSRVYMVPGQGAGGDLDATGQMYVEMPPATQFNHRCAVFAVGDLDVDGDSAGRDEVIGIDNGGECFGNLASPEPRLATLRFGSSGIELDSVVLPGAYRVPREARLSDVDDDGDQDVVVLFAGSYLSEANPADAAIAVVWNSGGALSLDNISVVPLPQDVGQLQGVAPIHADADRIPELIILADGGLVLARLDLTDRSYTADRLGSRGARGSLAVGDLDGDGLDDVAFTDVNDVRILLQQPAAALGAAGLENGPDAGASP